MILSVERIEKYKELNQDDIFVLELLEIIETLQNKLTRTLKELD